MEITEVRVTGVHGDVLKAFTSITLDNEFVVRGLRVLERQGVLFVSMPARRQKDGTYLDIAHPLCRQFRARLEHAVLVAYDERRGPEGAGARSPLRPGPPTLLGKAARILPWDGNDAPNDSAYRTS
jgi:stage V sporulation protein G